ncbi:MAG: LytR family transcriptional regulator [Ruminococcaceae bacterium]|nr:LytR family transcriptional regulator [Oscillospiraceae bacterium]
MKDKKDKIKLKKSAVVTFILSLISIAMCVVYFVAVYPMLGFFVNNMPDVNDGESVLSEGESIVDMSSLYINVDLSESGDNSDDKGNQGETTDKNQSQGSSSQGGSGSSGGSSIPTVPDPIVKGVSKISGKNLYFEPDAYNVLVLGQDNSSGLMDTIMIISICDRLNTVQVASIARDAYVPYSRSVVDALNAKGYGRSVGIYKINASAFVGSYVVKYKGGKFSNSGINFMCSVLQQILPNSNCDIDEYIYMNEDGFLDIIDVVGGITVNVTEDIYNGNGKLVWKKGPNYMNAKQCLGYVSARYRFSESGRVSSSGDPYRKANQLSFMRDFAAQIITVENIPRIPDIMKSLTKNVWHSFNTVSDITKYSDIAMKFAKNQYSMKMYVVNGKSINPLGDGASYVNLMG